MFKLPTTNTDKQKMKPSVYRYLYGYAGKAKKYMHKQPKWGHCQYDKNMNLQNKRQKMSNVRNVS